MEHEDYCLQSYSYQFSPELLKDRVAFITGGGSGIGFRIAELFMRHGCDTVIASRNLTKLEEVWRLRVCFSCQLSKNVLSLLNSLEESLEESA